MNITIVQTFTDGFTTYQSGQELSVPSEVAQRWIADGKAQADTDGQQSWLSSTEVAATRALVSRDGNVFGPENAASTAAGPQGWTALVPTAGITTSDAAVRISGGRYEFRGTLSGTIASDTVLTEMPAALKVDRLSRQLLPTSTGPATITVQADGAIVVGTVAGSPAAWISLDGLSAPFALMPADPFVSPLPTLPVVRVSTLGQAV